MIISGLSSSENGDFFMILIHTKRIFTPIIITFTSYYVYKSHSTCIYCLVNLKQVDVDIPTLENVNRFFSSKIYLKKPYPSICIDCGVF